MKFKFEITVEEIENAVLVKGIARWEDVHTETSFPFLKLSVFGCNTVEKAMWKFIEDYKNGVIK